MNLKFPVLNALCAIFFLSCVIGANARQTVVLQNGGLFNNQTYNGCKDTYVQNGNLFAGKNFESLPVLHLENCS